MVASVSVDEVCSHFRNKGRRVTPQRRAIIRALLDDGSHPTADQILVRVRDELPSISPATIYNTLHELVELGFLVELDLGLRLGERRYDVVTSEHDHLVCLGCGRLEDVPRRADALGLPPEHKHGFQIVNCRVIHLGYCPDCAAA